MADLFTLNAPVTLHLPDGSRHLAVALYRHPEGLLWFAPLTTPEEAEASARLLRGELRGAGPWRIGETTITLCGCHGGDPQTALALAQWQEELSGTEDVETLRAAIRRVAVARGALLHT